MAAHHAEDIDIEASFLTFAEETLGLTLYDWQADTLEPFDEASERLVMVSLATPNGSGKSAVVITTLVLGWLALYPKGRVVITTADGKQLDGQIMPAIESHRSKFPGWTFLNRKVTTPTGGSFVAFTTDQAGRAEGWHKLDDIGGPLLMIADEAKSIPEDIFTALDRCTYNGILLASSPGKMSGTFYESQHNPDLGYVRIAVGLKDCPHITQDKIDRIIAKHGANSPFTRSALHGEFIEYFDGEPVYYAYNQQAHEAENLGWPKGALLAVGMDVGTHNASVIAAVKEDAQHHLHVWMMREIILTGSDTDRQCVKLLQVLANEFPFWNKGLPVCPQALFFCDPAARNSSFTARGATSSALKVIHSHGIFPGMKTAVHLQPSIATVNRLLQQNHNREVQGGGLQTVWHFKIDKKRCPVLSRAMAAEYRYPAVGQAGYGNDLPLKGSMCNHVDHVCFVAGTRILTSRGSIEIQDVKTGDYALTRTGFKKVIAAGSRQAKVREYQLSNGDRFKCTPDHPFWNVEKQKMIPVDKLERKDTLLECNEIMKILCSMGGFFAGIQTRKEEVKECITERFQGFFTKRFGNLIMDPSQRGSTSTTKMGTLSTTTFQTLSACTQAHISQNIGNAGEIQPIKARYSGTEQRKDMRDTWKQRRMESGKNTQQRISVSNAGSNTKQWFRTTELSHYDSVHPNAREGIVSKHVRSMWIAIVKFAAKLSQLGKAKNKRSAHVVAAGSLESATVFNLTVEDAHEYFANGILVSNCDSFRYLCVNILDIAEEQHQGGMRHHTGATVNPEPKRTI